MLTQIINGIIHTPSGWMKGGSIIIDDHKILEVSSCDLPVIGAKIIDAKGMYVAPGGVEIHCHGGGGRDFMECTEDAFQVAILAAEGGGIQLPAADKRQHLGERRLEPELQSGAGIRRRSA